MAVFTVFFGILGKFGSEGVPYPVFVYTGLLIWQVVDKILTEGANSLISNAQVVRKIYFPRAYFPIAVALSSLVDLVFGLLALAVLLLIYRIVPGAQILLLPIPVAIGLMAALGAAFWLSALNVSYRDIGHLLPFLAQLWMFLTPIIYPSSIVPELYRPLLYLNPLTVAVDGVRWALIGTSAPPPPEAWVMGTIVALLLLVQRLRVLPAPRARSSRTSYEPQRPRPGGPRPGPRQGVRHRGAQERHGARDGRRPDRTAGRRHAAASHHLGAS